MLRFWIDRGDTKQGVKKLSAGSKEMLKKRIFFFYFFPQRSEKGGQSLGDISPKKESFLLLTTSLRIFLFAKYFIVVFMSCSREIWKSNAPFSPLVVEPFLGLPLMIIKPQCLYMGECGLHDFTRNKNTVIKRARNWGAQRKQK